MTVGNLTPNSPAAVSPAAAATGADPLSGLSLEEAIAYLHKNRIQLLESRLQDIISTIREKNAQMTDLNGLKTDMLALKAKFSTDAKDTDAIGSNVTDWDTTTYKAGGKISEAWEAAGLDSTYIEKFSKGTITKSEFEAAEQAVATKIDSLSSSSQMDMVTLQSVNGKRAEAFETITNILKKGSDTVGSLIRNLG